MLQPLEQKNPRKINLGFPKCVCGKPFTLVHSASELRAWIAANGDIKAPEPVEPDQETADRADFENMLSEEAEKLDSEKLQLDQDRVAFLAEKAEFEAQKTATQEAAQPPVGLVDSVAKDDTKPDKAAKQTKKSA